MPSLLDDFEGVLSKEELAKIRGNARLVARLNKGSELLGYYEGDETEDPPANPDPPARREAAPQSGDLSSITQSLGEITKKLDGFATKDDVKKSIEEGGRELAQTIEGRALRKIDELNRIYRRHEKEFAGEEFDGPAFEAWVNEQVTPVDKGGKGRYFQTITDAYEDFTKQKREDARVESKARERLKELQKDQNNNQVPGFTPPSAKSPLSTFMNRGKVADQTGKTSVDRAAEALRQRMAPQESQA